MTLVLAASPCSASASSVPASPPALSLAHRNLAQERRVATTAALGGTAAAGGSGGRRARLRWHWHACGVMTADQLRLDDRGRFGRLGAGGMASAARGHRRQPRLGNGAAMTRRTAKTRRRLTGSEVVGGGGCIEPRRRVADGRADVGSPPQWAQSLHASHRSPGGLGRGRPYVRAIEGASSRPDLKERD